MSDLNTLPHPTTTANLHWQDTANMGIGFWLFFSPGFLDFGSARTETWAAVGLGVVLIGIAATALHAAQAWREWAILAVGATLIVTPWVLGYATTAAPTMNAVACGITVVALALSRLFSIRHHGHGGHGQEGLPTAS